MTQPINPAFQEALRELGRPTSLEDLSRRGVTRMRSIKMTDISLLIERAVNRTLMERTIGPIDEAERAVILHEAENQFTRQLQAVEDLASAQASFTSQRKDVQLELERLQSVLTDSQARIAADSALRGVERRKRLSTEITSLLEPLYPDGRLDEPGREIARKLRELVEAQVEFESAEQRRQFEIEIDIQMRRVRKLMQVLEHTELVLERVAASKDLEQGIESIYRSVQGLTPGEKHFEIKQRLLTRIFTESALPGGSVDQQPAANSAQP